VLASAFVVVFGVFVVAFAVLCVVIVVWAVRRDKARWQEWRDRQDR
jgi:ABC-type Fe3+ transport system permease subunit